MHDTPYLMFGQAASTTFENCSSNFSIQEELTKPDILIAGENFFAYFTPVILLIGLVGNSLSLAVFCSKNMRKLSASSYLAALSVADISALIFYVFIEWLRRGLIHISPESTIPFLDKDGFCQTLLYMAYISRLMSSWIIVIFTIERFVGVCYPLKSFKRGARKILVTMFCVSCFLVLYKPILSGGYTIRGKTACASDPDFADISFVLDSIFAVSITLVPFIIITLLNTLIVRSLFLRNKRHADLSSNDTAVSIRLEFTLILLAISFFFVAFNLPYFLVWSINFLHVRSDYDYWKGALNITRTIFYMNYCVNFFLYSITGGYFRKELISVLCFRSRFSRYNSSHIQLMRYGSSRTHMTFTP